MIKNIEKCFEKKVVASFYVNKEDNCAHLTGTVCCFNENEVLIAHISPRGLYDGFVLLRIDDIYRMDLSGEYEKKIHYLYELKNQTHPWLDINTESILFGLLNFAAENNLLISAEMQGDTVTGLIKSYNDFFCLNLINENGRENGECIIDIDEIVSFSCDTDYEQDLKLLYERNNN